MNEQALQGLNLQEYQAYCSALDPVYYMRNFVKVRSQQDADNEEDDLEEPPEENGMPSSVMFLDPWPKQRELIYALLEDHWVIAPKSRKVGFTTVGVSGFGTWVQLFYPNSRVHYISRRDDASVNMLNRHKFSYKRLPDWLRLPIVKDNDHEFIVRGPDGDERVAQAYPATEDTAIEETADYTLIDEFASVREPLAGKLWSGLEPTIAPNGFVLIISRGKGPQGTFAELVRKAASGL